MMNAQVQSSQPTWGYKFPPFCTSACQTHTGAICGKYALVSITFSHRPDEAMSIWTWQKLV